MDDVFHICNKKYKFLSDVDMKRNKKLASILVHSEQGFHEEI